MTIHIVPALNDNYVYVLSSPNQPTIVIDPSEAEPVMALCEKLGLKPQHIVNTHHHYDHVDGNEELQKRYGCQVWCHTSDMRRVPGATQALQEGVADIDGWNFQILHIPGHTTGQIALHSKALNAVFVGDTLFRFGCGRLFEGDAPTMWASLKKLQNLPPETQVYCGHEYGLRNLEFLQAHKALPEPTLLELKKRLENELAAQHRAVPFTLEEQSRFNPLFNAPDPEAFAHWRTLRNQF